MGQQPSKGVMPVYIRPFPQVVRSRELLHRILLGSNFSFLNKTHGQKKLSCRDKTALCPLYGTTNLLSRRDLHYRLLSPVSTCVPHCEES